MIHDRIYAFRRKGQFDFCTCSEYRYHECAAMPELFEVAIFFTEQQLTAKDDSLTQARANDRTAMGYLAEVRAIIGGDDFPDMVNRISNLHTLLRDARKVIAITCTYAREYDDCPFVKGEAVIVAIDKELGK